MIYYFFWNNEFLIKKNVFSWKKQFLEKHWDFNFVHIKDLFEIDNNEFSSLICSGSFFNEKKLVIIDYNYDNKKDDFSQKKLDFFLSLLDKKDESIFLLLNSINPDKRTSFHKKLLSIWNPKEFSIKNDFDISSIINWIYRDKISSNALNKLIRYKNSNINKIISEIEKLLIYYDFIDEKLIWDFIEAENDENFFVFLDELLNLSLKEALLKMDTILQNSNIYMFYNLLLSNLRTIVFITKLKSIWERNIWEALWLWNKSFLVNKTYKISFDKLEKFYHSLVLIDLNNKSWKLIWNDEKDFKFELEKSIMSIYN